MFHRHGVVITRRESATRALAVLVLLAAAAMGSIPMAGAVDRVDGNSTIVTIAGTGTAGFSGDGADAVSTSLSYRATPRPARMAASTSRTP